MPNNCSVAETGPPRWASSHGGDYEVPSWCWLRAGTGKQRWRSGIPLAVWTRHSPCAQVSSSSICLCGGRASASGREGGSPGSKQDAGTQKAEEGFPPAPPASVKCQAESSWGEGRSTLQRAEMHNPMQPPLKNTKIWFWSNSRTCCRKGSMHALRWCLSGQPAVAEEGADTIPWPALLSHFDSRSLHLALLKAMNEKSASLPL